MSGRCFQEFAIAHTLDSEGFSDDWYDAIGDNGEFNTYFFNLPQEIIPDKNYIYVTVETYSENLIQSNCADGSEIPIPNKESITGSSPLAYYSLFYKNSQGELVHFQT